MFSSKKVNQNETTIPVVLDEQLTSESCSKLITELMKYILYQKQQIPFSCDTLLQLQTRYKPTDKNFNSTKNLFSTIDNITDELTTQLHTSGCDVKEIIIVIGATPVTPKFTVKFELPSNILNSKKHLEYQHSYRKPLLTLMRSLIDCEEFQQAMTLPQGPTNTFVLMQKSDTNSKSDFFLPKPQYSPPNQTAACFLIKLFYNKNVTDNCKCLNIVQVYHDNSGGDILEEISMDNCTIKCSKAPYLWYQSKEVVKGFKYLR